MCGVLYSQPCEGLQGGDVHYLSVCGSGLLSRVCLADVMGHGESVSAISQVMHEHLRSSINRIDERKVLRRLNLRLSRLEYGAYTTAAALTYFPPTGRLSISYAGHEPAWYYDAQEKLWLRLEAASKSGIVNTILAAVPRTRFTRCTRRTRVGDRLLMITDGVLEAPNDANELFGRARLNEVLESAVDATSADLVNRIIAALRTHTNGAPLHHDDISILAMEFVDNLQRPALWTALHNRLFRHLRRRT
jgi:serine phosphatase RsbU (regulator of sigma subunit)